MDPGVTIIIPTYEGGTIFSQCLTKIRAQDYEGEVQLIVVDSGSTDGTAELAEQAGAVVKRIDKQDFHHARTRNNALSFAKFAYIVYMVQDAVPCTNVWLSGLVNALRKNPVAAVYTAQVPHDDADIYARFETEGHTSHLGHTARIQSIESAEAFSEMPYEEAYRTVRLDNVCAIYEKDALLTSPFPEVDFAEDMAWALKNLLNGLKIMYEPRIKVRHSHNRSPEYNFKRQVVNSIWCARIMGRVERDLSLLTGKELMLLTAGIGKYVQALKCKHLRRSPVEDGRLNTDGSLTDQIAGKYPLREKMRKIANNFLSRGQAPGSSEAGRIQEEAEREIDSLLDFIKAKYGSELEGKSQIVLEQLVAKILGRIYGEVYASHMVKGRVPGRLEKFYRPYMQGV